ncbi:MAG TPA: THUMP domain-containing protein [Saprospiraceae bacterium]|nr:THUMP domain-containing protein [Saprospiraceae bacterium]HQW54644.1 THUMP domain-containing protein [Saprospiraceae bacterium]
MEIVVTTFKGLEPVLAAELGQLGAEDVSIGHRAVICFGDKELLYKINYLVRTGIKVLLPIAYFQARDPEELYHAMRHVDFGGYLSSNGTFSIDIVCHSEYFTHEQFAMYRIKDAIVDQMKKVHGERPSIDTSNPDFRLHVRISGDEITLSSDSSGDSLHKRNYKHAINVAPLNECLAAGIILLSGWDKTTPLWDPMAGSGTIGIEAAMIASDCPPQLLRSKFTFKKWRSFNPSLWSKVCSEAKEKIDVSSIPILMSDIDLDAVKIIRDNMENLPFAEEVKVTRADFFDLTGQGETLVFNPPYDQRMRVDDIHEFYSNIGDHMKKYFTGSTAWIFSSQLDALKSIGLKTGRKIPLFNGPLDSRLCRYDLFAGSHKVLKQQANSTD